MKKVILSLIIAVIVLVPFAMNGQTAIDKLYKKYAGEPGFTSINISPEMFSLLASLNTEDSTEKAREDMEVMEQLSGLKMLIYEPETGGNADFAKDVKSAIPLDEFSELMSVDSEDETVKFLVKKGKNNRISELLMIVQDGNEVVIMSMTGDLDMSTISSISKSLDIDGMETLDKIEEK